jgi:menaquinol-cytochrome c reductase iron-sulfur subunit
VEDKKVKRRDFMGKTIGVIGGLVGLSLGIPAVAYIVSPTLEAAGEDTWLRLGSISKINSGVPTLFKSKVVHQTGWTTKEESISVYILTENGRDFVAMSNICPHLGCSVRWVEDQTVFFCPCHNASFNKDGSVKSGPPPKPLDNYQVKVEDDQVFILLGG